jgi:hypothetical protein
MPTSRFLLVDPPALLPGARQDVDGRWWHRDPDQPEGQWYRVRAEGTLDQVAALVHVRHYGLAGAAQPDVIRSFALAALAGNPDAQAFLRAYGVEVGG